MNIVFTEHLKERLGKRKISEDEVIQAIKSPEKLVKVKKEIVSVWTELIKKTNPSTNPIISPTIISVVSCLLKQICETQTKITSKARSGKSTLNFVSSAMLIITARAACMLGKDELSRRS